MLWHTIQTCPFKTKALFFQLLVWQPLRPPGSVLPASHCTQLKRAATPRPAPFWAAKALCPNSEQFCRAITAAEFLWDWLKPLGWLHCLLPESIFTGTVKIGALPSKLPTDKLMLQVGFPRNLIAAVTYITSGVCGCIFFQLLMCPEYWEEWKKHFNTWQQAIFGIQYFSLMHYLLCF